MSYMYVPLMVPVAPCCVKRYMVLWRVYLFEAAGPLKTLHASRLTLHVFSLSEAARPIA